MANDRIFVSLEHSRVHIDAQGVDGPTIFWKGRPDTAVTIRAAETASLNPEAHPQLSSMAVRLVQSLSATGLFESFTFPAAFPWKVTAPLMSRPEQYSFDDLRAALERVYAEVTEREVSISQTSCTANRRWRRVTGTLTLRTLRRRRRARHHHPSRRSNERFREGLKDLVEDAVDSSGSSNSSSKPSSSSGTHGHGTSDGCGDGCDLGCDGCDGCGGCD